jgi:precorrin-6A/cobalt-precorrin-6A reductase
VIATTATQYGGEIIKDRKNLQILSRKLDKKGFIDVIVNNNINSIIDATHPFARKVSENIIEIAEMQQVVYYRYERKCTMTDYKNVTLVDSYEEAARVLKKLDGNILLTIGSRNIEKFRDISSERIKARILPDVKSIESANEAGLNASSIIALQGPFSLEMNKVMISDYNIKHLVTKESGKTGGTEEKIQAGIEAGINILVIRRPEITYPNKFEDIDELMDTVICDRK